MKTYNVWQNYDEDGFVYGEDDCPMTFYYNTDSIWKNGYISYYGEPSAFVNDHYYSYKGVRWDEGLPLSFNKCTLPLYFRGRRNDEEYIVKLSDWGDIGVCSLDEYYDAIALVERSTHNGLGDFLRRYPEYRFVFLDGDMEVSFRMNYQRFDVECVNKDSYYVMGFGGFSVTYPIERKEELRDVFLKHADGVTKKEFSVKGCSPEALFGIEKWTIYIGKLKIRVEWKERLPEHTKTYHGCNVHWSEPKLTKSTASLVCSIS